MAPQELAHLRRLSASIRMNAVRMIGMQGFGYLGQAFSSAEIFAVLFGGTGPARPPANSNDAGSSAAPGSVVPPSYPGGGLLRIGRDRFVLSPAHYVVALYAAAAEVGLLDRDELATYGKDGSLLEAIGTERTPLVDLVCGSLAQGLSGAIGFALAAHLAGEDRDTWAFLSDGEMEEGQTWEAAMFASHHRARMGRLSVVIDANNSQVDGPVTSVTTLEPLAGKWRAFGWEAREVDGHDISALAQALGSREAGDAPLVVIARTNTSGGLQSLPRDVDAHFIKLDRDLEQALLQELQAQLA